MARARADTESEAKKRYKGIIGKALGCITDAIPLLAETEGRALYALTTSEFPLLLGSREGEPVFLGIDQHVVFGADPVHPGEFKAHTRKYIYTLAMGDLDRPLVEWHWHPENRPDPHIHIPGLPAPMKTTHLPTGRVAIEEVIRYLIADLGVTPKPNEAAALATLNECQSVFEQFRSWPSRPTAVPAESIPARVRQKIGKRRSRIE